MSGRQIYSVFILDVTSILLALFGFLTALSGFCLTKPEVVERATLGAFSSHALCTYLHLGWTTFITVVVAIIHGAAGIDLWFSKMGRDGSWAWIAAAAAAIWFLYIYLG